MDQKRGQTTQLTIEGNAIVNLSGSSECNPDGSTGGLITVDGSLLVQDNATLENTNVDVKLLEFGGDNDIQFNNITLLEASTGFGGEFFVDNIATINCNTIVSEGDRYLDLDPDPESAEHPTITDNQITVIIKEGVSGSQGTLLELRAADYDFMDSGAYQVSPNSLGFTDDPSENWVLEKLIIDPNAKLNLTNRQGFEFQDFSDPNREFGDWESVYVEELILYPNAVLNTAFQTLYYQDLIIVGYDGAEILRNPADVSSPFVNGSRVEDIPLLGFSLAIIAMDDPTAPPHNEFDIRVRRRIRDPQDIRPDSCMDGSNPNSCLEGSIERIDDDPNIPVDAGGVMDMRTRAPGKQSASSVAAKGAFARAGDEDITIEFEYMFIEDPCDEAEMIVYLSDEPEVGQNLVEVARIRPPARGRPGSIESGSFAVFSGTFSRGDLNFVRGTYVELELRGTGVRCWVDNWDPKIYCQGAVCGDYDGMNNVTFIDYLYLLAEFGLSNPGVDKGCLDLVKDGVINADDLHVWSDANILNPCGEEGNSSMGAAAMAPTLHSRIELGFEGNSESDPLVIFGKPGSNTQNVPDGYLYRFDVNGTYVNAVPTPGNGRIVTDSTGKVYQIDARLGLIGRDACAIVVEPNNNILFENSRVSVGIKDKIGLPLSDAAFDPYDPNIVYIVPVLVAPPSSEGCPYMAAAKLELTGECNYKIKKLYGKNPAKDCNNAPDCNNITDCNNVKYFVYEPDVQHLCEIEIDLYGNLYVLSSLWTNDNNWVLIYNANVGNASEERVWLNEPNLPDPNLITGPTAMVVSSLENKLYLASSANTLNDPDDLAAKVFSFTIDRVGQRAFGLTYQDPLVVNCPAPNLDICGILPGFCEDPNKGFFSTITSMTEKPTDGTLYVTGFTSPKFTNDYEFPPDIIEIAIFTTPLVAVIPSDTQEPVDANVIIGCDLALPLSIVWTGSSIQDKCRGADIDNSGDVSYLDLSIIALQWLQSPGIPSADIAPQPSGDGIVNLLDLAILSNHWLETGCLD